MTRRKNKIAEAFEQLQDDDEFDEASETSEDELDDEAEDFEAEVEVTDEEVVAEVARLDKETQAAIQSSRKPGRVSLSERKRRGREARQRREIDARKAERERDAIWQNAATLDAPPPLPGMEQRWIRVAIDGRNDPRNITRKAREKWVPRKLDTVPQEYAPPTISHGSMGEVIGVLDLMLCHRPIEVGRARRKFFSLKTQRQRDAADHRHTDQATRRGGPGIQRQVKRDVTRGVGRRNQVQED